MNDGFLVTTSGSWSSLIGYSEMSIEPLHLSTSSLLTQIPRSPNTEISSSAFMSIGFSERKIESSTLFKTEPPILPLTKTELVWLDPLKPDRALEETEVSERRAEAC